MPVLLAPASPPQADQEALGGGDLPKAMQVVSVEISLEFSRLGCKTHEIPITT